jgi:glycine/D-amino acid oxidase-like deaminating enzyme
MQAFRHHARARGVRYLADEAVGLARSGERIERVRLASGEEIASAAVVNAGGPWAAAVAAMAEIDLPVRARCRSVFVFDCRAEIADCPLIIDTSGVWARREGAHFICGVSPPEDQDPDDPPLEVDHHLFDDIVWPALAHRVPAFEAVKVVSSWAGYYEYNTFDQNGIVGRHRTIENLYFANGFSGHGIQQSPAVGRGLAELIAHGAYRSFERIVEGRPLRELNVI